MKARLRTRRAATHAGRFRIRYHRPGAAPGTLEHRVIAGAAPTAPARLSQIRFDKEALEEKGDLDLADCAAPAAPKGEVTWLHVQGLPTPEQLQRIGELYTLHPLALEDVFNQQHRAKFETYESHYFVVLDRLLDDGARHLEIHQVNFFLGRNYLISIDEGPGDVFEPVRQRVRNKQAVRARGADYLFYALMDLVIDNDFPLLEKLGEDIEALENEVLDNPNQHSRNRIHYIKRELVQMRRAWWPQREVIAGLIRDGDKFLTEHTRLYLRDCYDHSVTVMDFVETYREMTSSLLDTYLSSVSQRMNDIMKALTIIATIFLPLTFVAGIYGMNFDGAASPWNMPELRWRYGYFYALGVMAAVVAVMLVYFRRKRWL